MTYRQIERMARINERDFPHLVEVGAGWLSMLKTLKRWEA